MRSKRLSSKTVARLRRLDGPLLVAGCLVPLALLYRGLVSTSPYIRHLFIGHAAPVFLAACLWLRQRFRESERPLLATIALDLTVLAIAFGRPLGVAPPLSGPMVLYIFSALTTRLGWYQALVALLILPTTFETGGGVAARWEWLLGTLAGLAMVVLYDVLVGVANRRQRAAEGGWPLDKDSIVR
jgi:hypothetical protein